MKLFHFFVIRLQDSLFLLFFFSCEIFTKNELKTIVFFSYLLLCLSSNDITFRIFLKGLLSTNVKLSKTHTHKYNFAWNYIKRLFFFILFGYLTKKRVSNHNWFANFSLNFCFRFRVDNFASEHLQKGFFSL